MILSPGCKQPFLIKMASDNRLSAAVFGPKWLATTGCHQPLPKNLQDHLVSSQLFSWPWKTLGHSQSLFFSTSETKEGTLKCLSIGTPKPLIFRLFQTEN